MPQTDERRAMEFDKRQKKFGRVKKNDDTANKQQHPR